MEYGLIGKKLGHSYSKIIHEKLGFYTYDLKELKEEELEPYIEGKDYKGLNVTIPYKEKVMPFLDEIDIHAQKIGCVNTIVNRDGFLKGYNTDYYGLMALLNQSGVSFEGKKVLILGTGGTSKTCHRVLEDLKVKDIYHVSRREEWGNISYETAVRLHSDADYIVNTTPVGMYPNIDASPISLKTFDNLKGVTDVIYNPHETVFTREASEKGIFANTGLYMLVVQAVKACELFLDCKIKEEETVRIYNEVKEETK